jgi:PD-(D/E)XK nuclease superfamily
MPEDLAPSSEVPDPGAPRPEDDAPLLPKVTPSLVRAASTMCTRRLHAEFTGALGHGADDPVNRSRVRDALIDAVRVRHASGAAGPLPDFLLPEECEVIKHALGCYVALFGDETATLEMPVEEPTTLLRRGVRLGGWVDLGLVHDDGTRELRQLALGLREPPVDPLDLEAIRLAVLRLANLRWVANAPLALTWADLLTGALRRRTLHIPDDLEPLAEWLDDALAIVTSRTSSRRAEPGRDCGRCRFVPGCPALGVRGSMTTRRGDLLPGVLSISPTSLDTWDRCRREWRARVLLGLPPSDPDAGTAHGLLLHRLLRFVHEQGSCGDAGHVAEVLAGHGADARTGDEIRRHAARCPVGADDIGHELEWVRANARPPVFVATARFDAVWAHDGLLDVRDYKSGRLAPFPLHEDRRARLQAWVAAPQAEQRGLRLRLRYEHLAAEVGDDPDAWEPDADDLAAVEDELLRTVGEMRAERDWRGVADRTICEQCRYRSICPDSAAPGQPGWPELGAADPEVVAR